MTATEKSKKIPDHYSPVMPYLVVPDADELIRFIKAVFNAKELLRVDTAEGSVMHAEYGVNGGTIMFGQAGSEWKAFPCSMYVVESDVDGVYARAIENGATGNMPPEDKDYGRAAGFIDKSGNQWWLNDPGI
jgi:uncharacterized glyoxalase superfamily protein PhnB